MSENNIRRIFKEKMTQKWKDKHIPDMLFTTQELNEMWLAPTMQDNPDPTSQAMKGLEVFLERYEKA